jgi:hypothetical protein
MAEKKTIAPDYALAESFKKPWNDIRRATVDHFHAQARASGQVPDTNAIFKEAQAGFLELMGPTMREKYGMEDADIYAVMASFGADGGELYSTWERDKTAKGVAKARLEGIKAFYAAQPGMPSTLSFGEGMRQAMVRAGLGAKAAMAALWADKEIQLLPGMEPVTNPFYDEEAARDMRENPKLFLQKALLKEAYDVPGYKNPGAKQLEAAGMNPFIADIITYDILDPISWVGGKPLTLMMGIGGGVAAYKAGRLALAARNARKLMNGDEMIKFARGLGHVARSFMKGQTRQSVFNPKQRPLTSGQDFLELEREAINIGAKLPGKKEIAALKVVESMGERSLKSGLALEKLLDGLEPWWAQRIMQLRVQQIAHGSEIAEVERLVMKYLPKGSRPPKEWFDNIEMFDHFLTPAKRVGGKVVRHSVKVRRGLVTDFYRHPDHYFTDQMNSLRDTPKGRALRDAMGMENLQDIKKLKEFREYTFVGNHARIREVRAALEKLYSKAGLEELTDMGSLLGRIGLRQHRALLQNTGAFDTVVEMGQLMAMAKEARQLEFMGALGATAFKWAGTDVLSHMVGGASKVTLKSIPKIARGQARDLNDKVASIVGGKTMADDIARKRTKEGLSLLDMKVVAKDKEAVEMARKIKHLFDDMAHEAVNEGLITPDQVLKEYLPRIMEDVRQGKTLTQSLDDLDAIFRTRGQGEAQPFFTMLRNGEVDLDAMTDLPKLVDAYTTALYRHKYMNPVLEELTGIAKSVIGEVDEGGKIVKYATKNVQMGKHDAHRLLDFVTHHKGGMSNVQLSVIHGMTTSRNMFKGLFGAKPKTSAEMAEMVRTGSRRIANMYYSGYMGMRTGLAMRNLTQKSLAWGLLGRGLPGPGKQMGYFVKGQRRWNADEVARLEFQTLADESGWTKHYVEFLDAQFKSTRPLGQKAQDASLFMYSWADYDNRAKVYMAAREYVDDLFKNRNAGKEAWREASKKMRPAEKALFEQAVLTDDIAAARKSYGRFLVNETQWLYSKFNRPAFTNIPILGHAYMFMSWPFNLSEALVQAGSIGMREFGKKPGQQANIGHLLGAAKGMNDYIAPYMTMSLGLGAMAAPFGVDLFRWGLADAPRWMQDKYHIDYLPIPRALQGLAGAIPFVGDPTEGTAMGRLVDSSLIAGEALIAAIGSGEPVDQQKMNRWAQSLPRPLALMPAVTALGETFIPDRTKKRNTAERIGAALFDVPDRKSYRSDETVDEAIRRTQGIAARRER